MDFNKQDNRYVAYFDMLGFKEAVRRDIDEAWGALEDVRVSAEETINLFLKCPSDVVIVPNKERVAAAHFSDSVVLFTLTDEAKYLHNLLVSATALFAKALHRCIPLRVAISWGRFYFNFDKQLYCGIPLIEAYEMAEGSQWSGIVVDDGVAERYKKNPLTSCGKEVITRWRVPFKSCHHNKSKESWVLNWPLVCKQNFATETPISPQLYSNAFETLFKGTYKDWHEEIRAKYDNTLEFVNASLSGKME